MRQLPLLFATCASIVAWIGWQLIQAPTLTMESSTSKLRKRSLTGTLLEGPDTNIKGEVVTFAGATSSFIPMLTFTSALATTFFISLLLSGSKEISVAIATLASSIPWLFAKRQRSRKLRERESAWPSAIDTVVSALHSGSPVIESLEVLSNHGPASLSPVFQKLSRELRLGRNFEDTLRLGASLLNSGKADQFFITLIFAKEFGGNSVQRSLRFLANFMRDEQQMFEEINTKFGWVRNSATLAALAPWLLLLLLATQPSTVAAYATDAGKLILVLGVVATVIAYVWMDRISRLPTTPRILFQHSEKP